MKNNFITLECKVKFMTATNEQLWSRIESFQLDVRDADFTFSERLARENGWIHKYAKRVIEEYKKFIFLCCISETGVTPSDAVDQAWHLHLTFSKSYWIDLCKNTLGKEIHHNPTKGGQQEAQKFNDFYSNTLTLYKSEFGETPPYDIWPNNQTRFSDIDFQRVNLKKYWLVRKPQLVYNRTLLPIVLALLIFLFMEVITNDLPYSIFFAVMGGFLVLSLNKPATYNSSNNSSDIAYINYETSHHNHHDNSHHAHSEGDSSHSGSDSGCSSGCSGCSSSGCSGCGSSD